MEKSKVVKLTLTYHSATFVSDYPNRQYLRRKNYTLSPKNKDLLDKVIQKNSFMEKIALTEFCWGTGLIS